MVFYCCVKVCSVKEDGTGTHRFPITVEMFTLWLTKLDREDIPFDQKYNYRVHLHLSEKQEKFARQASLQEPYILLSVTVECRTMEAIWDSLLCSNCKKYLSVFPIKVYPDRSVKCGRCNTTDDGGTVSKLYESLAGKMKFPCVNRYEGCRAHLTPENMKVHENNCSSTIISCLACSNDFQGHSFTIVQHFKQQHQTLFLKSPEVVINFNVEIGEQYYMYASSTDNILVMIYVYYNMVSETLFFEIAPIFGEKFEVLYKFELWAFDNILYKSEEKSSIVAKSGNGFTFSKNLGIPIQKLQYKDAATCKFYIEKKAGEYFDNLFEVDKIKIPEISPEPIRIEVFIPCNLEHVTDNPIMMKPSKCNRGTMTFTFSIEEVKSVILEGERRYSSIFYLANTSWKCYVKKYKNFLYIYLEKVNDPNQNKFSYEMKAEFTLSSLNGNQHEFRRALPEKKIGLRNAETMHSGIDIIHWANLMNPKFGYFGSKGDIEVTAGITLIDTIPHESRCPCSGCSL